MIKLLMKIFGKRHIIESFVDEIDDRTLSILLDIAVKSDKNRMTAVAKDKMIGVLNATTNDI